jgi:hypothetical protein
MAIQAQFPPNLIITIGILRPVKWLRTAKQQKTRRCVRKCDEVTRQINRRRLSGAERG